MTDKDILNDIRDYQSSRKPVAKSQEEQEKIIKEAEESCLFSNYDVELIRSLMESKSNVQ